MFKGSNRIKLLALIVTVFFVINVIVFVKLLFFTEYTKTYTKEEYSNIMHNKEEL